MFNVGRLCTKIAGRDAGCKCVIVEELDNGLVLVDGQTRRRKCNSKHLEPSKETIDLKSGASHADVKKAFEALNIEVIDTKPKTSAPKPVKAKAKKVVVEKPKKAAKKAKPEVKTVDEPKADKSEAQAETVKEVQAELTKEE